MPTTHTGGDTNANEPDDASGFVFRDATKEELGFDPDASWLGRRNRDVLLEDIMAGRVKILHPDIAWMFNLIQTPGEGVPMVELISATKDDRIRNDKRSKQPAFDQETLRQSYHELRELRSELDRAKADNNSVEADRLQTEIEELTQAVAKSVGPGGKSCDLNNLWDKIRPTIHARLRDAYEKMRNANPPMGRLAEHFELSISSEQGQFIYRPSRQFPGNTNKLRCSAYCYEVAPSATP